MSKPEQPTWFGMTEAEWRAACEKDWRTNIHSYHRVPFRVVTQTLGKMDLASMAQRAGTLTELAYLMGHEIVTAIRSFEAARREKSYWRRRSRRGKVTPYFHDVLWGLC